jgi:hypothetical protein
MGTEYEWENELREQLAEVEPAPLSYNDALRGHYRQIAQELSVLFAAVDHMEAHPEERLCRCADHVPSPTDRYNWVWVPHVCLAAVLCHLDAGTQWDEWSPIVSFVRVTGGALMDHRARAWDLVGQAVGPIEWGETTRNTVTVPGVVPGMRRDLMEAADFRAWAEQCALRAAPQGDRTAYWWRTPR